MKIITSMIACIIGIALGDLTYYGVRYIINKIKGRK